MSCTGCRMSGDLPMHPGETLSMTVTLPNAQRIEVSEAVVRWSRGNDFAVEMTPQSPLAPCGLVGPTASRIGPYRSHSTVLSLTIRASDFLKLEAFPCLSCYPSR